MPREALDARADARPALSGHADSLRDARGRADAGFLAHRMPISRVSISPPIKRVIALIRQRPHWRSKEGRIRTMSLYSPVCCHQLTRDRATAFTQTSIADAATTLTLFTGWAFETDATMLDSSASISSAFRIGAGCTRAISAAALRIAREANDGHGPPRIFRRLPGPATTS